MKQRPSTKHSQTGLISLVHANVRGRARFDVPGIYRAPHLKQKLEDKLNGTNGIHLAKASALTGRLLILYDSDITYAEIISLIEAKLEVKKTRCTTVRPNNRPWKLSLSSIVDDFVALYRRFNTSYLSAVKSEAVAGMAGTNQCERQDQELRSWHLMEPETVLEHLHVSEKLGLNLEEVGVRLQRYGENRLMASERRSDLAIFVEQFLNAPVGLLGTSAVVSVMTGGTVDAAVILGVVLINAVIGFITERQAEKTISSLAETGVREVTALRDGMPSEILVETIVPGDILLLTPGTFISADLRLLQSHRLSVDESALTGESLPVPKDHKFRAQEETPLADRHNMAYMGTHVTGGNGRGVVIATARATELGQIQTMVGEAEAPETPMQKQLDKMGTTLALLSGAVCAGVFGVGVLRGYGWLEMLKASVSLAVAAVPEGLPAVATTTLAMGIAEMRRHNVAIRHLDAVETLGSVQVFCMDKTGTLTKNRMAVVAVSTGQSTFAIDEQRFTNDGNLIEPTDCEELMQLMQVVSLCSETRINGTSEAYELEGSPTESALVDLALTAGIDVIALRLAHPRLHTRFRAEERPYMSTLHPQQENGKYLLAVKGSPAEVLAICNHQIVDGKYIRLSDEAREAILAQNEKMAGKALRVLGVAKRELEEDRMPAKTDQLVWLGLAGMADPMRSGMDELIAQYHRAGIETIMITGDQSATAQAIGEQLGLSQGRALKVLESSHLDEMDPELLAGLVKNVHVFARVSPAHKLKIVRALQDAGYVVAMTGDGINDGPALKASDIGVAMGGSGTNVARDVSDVVLEDDNLHTMTTAVRQGRTIYNNIRKMIHFMISTNLTEIEVMLIGIAAGWGQPMNPMQLLWINLVTDIFPGLALSLEPSEKDIMARGPRNPQEAIISADDLKRMLFESATIGLGTMGAYLYGVRNHGAGPSAATLAFNTLTFNELAHALSSRSKYRHIFGGQKLPPNPHLTRAIIGMIGLQVLVSIVPGARRLLGTTPLGIGDLAAIAGGVLLPLIINESTKPSISMPAEAAIEIEQEKIA